MITLTTILYEGNFKYHLKENNWFKDYKSKYITKKRLLVNNLFSRKELEDILNESYDPEEVELVYVSDYSDEVIDYFKLSISEDDPGYNYTVPYFVNIYTCNTPYFFNVSSDCCVDICVKDSFFEKSIKLLNGNNLYPITALSWGKDWSVYGYPDEITRRDITCVGQWEQVNIENLKEEEELEDFWLSPVFWDGVFIGHVDKLKKINYQECYGSNFKMAVSPYGGRGAFENRIADYLKYKNIYRPILKSKTQYAMHSGFAP